MPSLLKTAIHQRKITLFLALIVIALGLSSYRVIPKQENPDVSAPVALITIVYPGASPEDMEYLVTKHIEEAGSELPGADYVESWSADSLSITLVTLKNEADPEVSWTELRRKINELQPRLPSGCEAPRIDTKLIDTAGMIISLSGEGYTYDQLVGFAETFKRELTLIPGISRFDIVGKIDKAVHVEVDYRQLSALGLSLDDIHQILQSQNIQLPAGSIKSEEKRIVVRAPGNFETLRDIEDTIIHVSSRSGAPVHLGDIAKVSMKEVENYRQRIRHNGRNAVLLAGFFQPEKNIVLVGRQVRERLEQLKLQFPPDLHIDEVTFEPEDIHRSVSHFMSNVIQGMLLVILVVFMAMGFRNALVVSTAIPLSILLTFLGMNLLGIKIQQISTTALIIALGMLVDNAIVITQAAQVRIDGGMDRLQAALEAARESAIPLFTSTLTTVAAFSPLLSLPGASGQFMSSIPQVVILALSSSYLVAMLVTPALSSLLFRAKKRRKAGKQRLKRFFLGTLSRALKAKGWAILISFSLLVAALVVAGRLPQQFFPYADKNILYINIREEHYDLKRTEQAAARVEQILSRQPEVIAYTTSVGDDLPRFYITATVEVQSPDYAQIMLRVDLKRGDRFQSNQQLAHHLQETLQARMIGSRIKVMLLDTADPREGSVILRINGQRMERIIQVAREVQERLREIPGTIGIENDITDAGFHYRIASNARLANALGISKYDIQRQINLALQGDRASVYRVGGKEYDIILKSNLSSVEGLENFTVKSSVNGNSVLLKQFADISLDAEIPVIKRYNKERTITVFCNVDEQHSAIKIEDLMEQQVLPELDLTGVRIAFAGQREQIERDFGNVGRAALYALVAVFLILLFEFASFGQTLVILLTIPLSFIGSVLGLLIFRQPLSFTALLGMTSLIGVVVNNAILLIEFINKARACGMRVHEACLDAAGKRFVPILMTTITTVMGLVPLALSGSELFGPLSVVLMCGLLVSTFLTLVIIPVVYSLFNRDPADLT